MGESIRLQKILAQAGCGSRRACEVFITDGRVTVDGIIVRQLGSKADPETQQIELDSNKIAGPGKLAKGVKASGEHVYWMLNKPKGVLCTNEDPSGRALAVHMVPEKRRVFCVGRLDKDTEGLIILTNDGELTNQLTHPRYGVEKVYVARVDGRAMPQQIAKLQRGVHLAEGKTQGARVRLRKAAGSQSILELTISEGMNRQVRRMLAAVGLYVRGLKRVSVGPVRLGEIGPGESRLLTSDELDRLRAAIRTAQQEADKPVAAVQEEVEEESDEDRVPQKKAKKEPGEKLKRRDAKHKAAHPTDDADEDAPKIKRQKGRSSDETELPDMDEAAGTRTALTPVYEDGSTTQEAPAVSDVAGDATQAASAIDKELEGDDSDEDDGEFGIDTDDEELSEAETAPQQPIEAGDDDEDDVEAEGDDEDGIVIKRKKNLNAAAALDDDEDTAEMDGGVQDDDDEPFDTANPLSGKNEKQWVDRGDREDPRLNAAAADKQHREEERENRKRQRTAAAAREGSAAGKPRGDYRAPGGRSGARGDYKPRQNQGRPARGGQGGERAPRPYGDRPQSGAGDRDRSEHFRPRSGPKFSGPKRDSPAFDKRKTWGESQRGAESGEKRGGGRPYEKREGAGAPRGDREGGRPAWKSSGPRDGERKTWSGPRKDGERKTWTPRKDGERKTWTPRKDGERKAWSGPPRERTGGSSGGDRGPRPQSREGGAPRGDRPYQKKTYGDRPSYGGSGGGQKRPYSPGGARPERSDRGGADKRGPRPEWRGSSSGGAGGRKPDSRSGGGDRPRAPRADGEKRGFSPRPWENKSRGGSGGSRGGSGGGDRGGAGPRQTRPWEKREPRSGGSDRPKRNEGGDE